jgi:hypothetical protein
MEEQQTGNAPNRCPVCDGELMVTQLKCSSCDTEVNGSYALGRLAGLREPHASLVEMFLRVRGNVKEMERELGLSYPTVRARLDEAFQAAGFPREAARGGGESESGWDARFETHLSEQIRAHVEHALGGLDRSKRRADRDVESARQRAEIIERLEGGEISASEAAAQLRELKARRKA